MEKGNQGSAPRGQDLIIERIFDSPTEVIWKAWTNPGQLKVWWGPRNYTVPFCSIDLRVGGRIFFCMRSTEGKDIWNLGIYREILKPERLITDISFADGKGNKVPASYYGMSPDFPMDMVVTVTFEELEGKTRMTLRHAGIPPGADLDGARVGWSQSFDKLSESLAQLVG